VGAVEPPGPRHCAQDVEGGARLAPVRVSQIAGGLSPAEIAVGSARLQQRMGSESVALRVAVLSTHTCPLAPLGGWETGGMNVYIRELGRALAARGVAVDIFTRRQNPNVPDVVEYAPGARVVHLDAGPHRHVDKYDVVDYLPEFACGVQRWRALTGLSYDLVHAHYWLSGRLAVLFGDRWGVPVVSMFHTLAQLKNRVAETAAEREQAIRYEIERRTMAGSDRVVAATAIDRQQIMRHYGNLAPIAVIPGGVDLQLFSPGQKLEARRALGLLAPLPLVGNASTAAGGNLSSAVIDNAASGASEITSRSSGGNVPARALGNLAAGAFRPDEKILLFVGRIQRLKGLEVLLRAFAHLQDVDARVVVVGGQPSTLQETREIARLQHLATRLGIAERVVFLGALPHEQLALCYRAADVTVMPSSYESFGLVAVESLACGTPVVATRVGGLTSIVRDTETGFLVPWRDPALFAERIRAILTDPELAARLSAQARPSVERYGWARIADEHLALYAEVLAARRPQAAATAT
jgi:D-inositol-3-phosphate glycosyltransferase